MFVYECARVRAGVGVALANGVIECMICIITYMYNMYIYIYIYVYYVHTYIYIYIYRERDI